MLDKICALSDQLKNRLFWGFVFLTTVLIRPWRTGFAQDDGVYAAQSQLISHGAWVQHPLLLAAAWPQTILGAVFFHIFPHGYSAALNLLTWICFLFLIFMLRHWWRIPVYVCTSIFIFPAMVQHGASFLSEIYAFVFLALAVQIYQTLKLHSEREAAARENNFPEYGLLFLVVFALCLQRQTLIAFPFCWGLADLYFQLKKGFTKKLALPLFALSISLLSLVLYSAFPKSDMQNYFLSRSIAPLLERSLILSFSQLFTRAVESVVVAGLLFIPVLFTVRLRKKDLILNICFQGLFILLMYFTNITPLSSGILFTSYFPRLLSIFLWSFGVWGLSIFPQVHRFVPEGEKGMWWGTLLALLPIGLFYAVIRENVAGDIRYSLPAVIPLLFLSRHFYQNDRRQNQSYFLGLGFGYLGIMTLITVFMNCYNLDTMEARWREVRRLESQNVPKNQISAGFGRDVFELGYDCTLRAILKAKAPAQAEEREYLFKRHILDDIKMYADGWTSAYVIKPYSIFGHQLSLNQNVMPGQSEKPNYIIEYATLGISNQLAIFRNSETTAPWCDQK